MRHPVPGPAYSAPLQFDSARHRYTCAGVEVPSVTSILPKHPGLGFVPEEFMTVYADRGTEVHRVAAALAAGKPPPPTVFHDSLQLAEKWLRFLDVSGWRVVASEMRVMSWRRWYAGTLDYLVDTGYHGLAVVDLKTGAADMPRNAHQVTGYAAALLEDQGINAVRGAVVSLKTDAPLPKAQTFEIATHLRAWLRMVAEYHENNNMEGATYGE